ncbi:MAG TPA: hypothetical protein VN493_16375 [Thermoanaerobaculia bacterium]|nr:hypothetical protein [Thermoanaerobaculia bacterium]
MKRSKLATWIFVLTLGLLVGYLGGLSTSKAVAEAPIFRSNNLYFEPATDPTGHNHPTAQLVFKDAEGTLHRAAFFIFEHNTAGLKAFVGNGCDGDVFETDVNGRLAVQYP